MPGPCDMIDWFRPNATAAHMLRATVAAGRGKAAFYVAEPVGGRRNAVASPPPRRQRRAACTYDMRHARAIM